MRTDCVTLEHETSAGGVQERVRADSISDEAAELHSLLQTAKTERSSQGQALDTLRAENEELMHRQTHPLLLNIKLMSDSSFASSSAFEDSMFLEW